VAKPENVIRVGKVKQHDSPDADLGCLMASGHMFGSIKLTLNVACRYYTPLRAT